MVTAAVRAVHRLRVKVKSHACAVNCGTIELSCGTAGQWTNLQDSPPICGTLGNYAPSISGLSSIGHKGDIGVNIGSLTRLSGADKYALLVDLYVPPTSFNFPKHAEHGKQRSFQLSWLTKYPWLAYSRLLDGGFCLPCAVFSRGGGGDRVLVEKPMCK